MGLNVKPSFGDSDCPLGGNWASSDDGLTTNRNSERRRERHVESLECRGDCGDQALAPCGMDCQPRERT